MFTSSNPPPGDNIEIAKTELAEVKTRCKGCIDDLAAAEKKVNVLTGPLSGQTKVGGGRRRKSGGKSTKKRRRGKNSLLNITKKWNPFAK